MPLRASSFPKISGHEKNSRNDRKITIFTPGRVNLIGEHTDYNGGMVLPAALENGVTVTFSGRKDELVYVQSDGFPDAVRRPVREPAQNHWSDVIIGTVALANETGLLTGGADIHIGTTLAFGAGISSSAAVSVGILKAIRDLTGNILTDVDIAVLARRVENDYIGVPCGIMDQMAVAIAPPGQALALDTATLTYDLVALPADFTMAIIHSGHQRQLSDGRYKERKEECDRIKAALGHENICRMTDTEFSGLAHLSSTLKRRARHCMTEHRRTITAISSLREGRIDRLGTLMNESHISMRDDFEVTIPATDQLVAEAVSLGAVGARQTGGGFGGCIVACVATMKVESWRAQLLAQHPAAYWVGGITGNPNAPLPVSDDNVS